MSLSIIMSEIAGEKKTSGEHKKHYIPFSVEEFNRLRVYFETPQLTPNDVKLVLLACADGKLKIVKV